jgi:hypothetical protein
MLDIGKGDRVAILMLNQDRYFELYLAIASNARHGQG